MFKVEVEEAIQLLQQKTKPNEVMIDVPLLKARNQVLACDLTATMPVPSFPKSSMDGYAVASADTKGASEQNPVSLRVVGEICAGDAWNKKYEANTAIRVMTGGLVPEGYDCVIKQEDTNLDALSRQFDLEQTTHGYDVKLYHEMKAFENYCPIGEDVEQGTQILAKNKRLTSHDIGMLASLGYVQVPIYRPMRVGIISTGNEIATLGTPLQANQIYNSSAYAITAQIQAAGLDVVLMDTCRDEIDVLQKKIEACMPELDLLITTGAVSVGKKDIIPATMQALDAGQIFQRVRMKPGTPVIASDYQDKIILSLSGNPFAAIVNFNVFFWPIAAQFMHNERYQLKTKQALICDGELKQSSMRRFVRAFIDEEGVHLYTKRHYSSIVSNLAGSNCFIEQPANETLKIGNKVVVHYWNA